MLLQQTFVPPSSTPHLIFAHLEKISKNCLLPYSVIYGLLQGDFREYLFTFYIIIGNLW